MGDAAQIGNAELLADRMQHDGWLESYLQSANAGNDLVIRNLGFSGDNFARFAESYSKPYGMILVTGPTGSGKSTTLYATLNILSQPQVNVITVEDPVEYRLPGINQVQTNNKAGLTFASALRSILRADPNIVMIGEIRDLETAEIAIRASLTGHLVFSTLHTNDAMGGISRLVDMGVEPFLVSAAVRAFLAQRLVRRLCPNCKTPREITEQDVVLDTRFGGPEYGLPSEGTMEAIRLCARQEGMLTDPVYEGKSMHGMIDMVRGGEFPAGSKVLYAHLGGVPALNAYSFLFRNG